TLSASVWLLCSSLALCLIDTPHPALSPRGERVLPVRTASLFTGTSLPARGGFLQLQWSSDGGNLAQNPRAEMII
ncbi:MAG: hypothetical protein MUF52_16310, partial [Syntrophobacteraceae bacterium]|nr:hypothetical protein [Syntrophobacteraceae bacterium]